MIKRRLLGVFATLTVIIAALCIFSTNTFADVPSTKDGQKLCGTFTYEVPGHSVSKQDFQICGIVDADKKFKGSLELRTDNWNNSIAYVEANGNAVTVYDSPTNNNWVVGGKPGCIALPGCSGRQQFKAEVGQGFSDTLYGVRNYLSGLNNRMYWPGGSAGSYAANLKYDIDWSVEDSTADDTLAVANNKKKCEDGGGTWSGDATAGYTCSNDDTLNIAPSSNAGSTGSNKGNACYSNAGALGWILCPVIEAATEAIDSVYSELEENYLKIDVSNIFNDDSGVENAWATFRDIANIVFIVLFVVVILSQLTGFGIDNYGIKKILPKIIIVAVLINLSYIICQLAVDVSNIIGVGLRGFLEGLIPADPIAGTNADGAQWTVHLAGGSIAIGAAIAATGGIGLLGAILGAVVAAVVAVFFLWVILVVRSAGIVILITIAPLAIACYLLPNTEKLTKRWVDIFKALLVLYPLCSLVVGAGAMAGHILSYSDSDIMQLAAMIVQVAPFFFIPTLLRRSLDGMGNIGARLGNIGRTQGRNFGGRARQALNGSNFAQNKKFNADSRRINARLKAAEFTKKHPVAGTLLGARFAGGSQQTQTRLANQRATLQNEERKVAMNSWRDENGNIQLTAVQDEVKTLQNKANSNGGRLNRNDTIRMQAALDAWGSIHSASLAEEIKGTGGIVAGGLSGPALDYAQSNGELVSAISKEDQVAGKFLKDRSNPSSGVTTYATWSPSNEVSAIQSLGAKKILGQDKDVIKKQAKHYTQQQFQDMKSTPGALASLDEVARTEVVYQARRLYGIDLET